MATMISGLVGIAVAVMLGDTALAADADDPRLALRSHPSYLVGNGELGLPGASAESRLGIGGGRTFAGILQAEGALSVGYPLGWGADVRLRLVIPTGIVFPTGARIYALVGGGPTVNLLGGFLGIAPPHETDVVVDPDRVRRMWAVVPETALELRLPVSGEILGFGRLSLGVPIVVSHSLAGLCRFPVADGSPCETELVPNAPGLAEKGWWWYLRLSGGVAW